MPVISSIQNLPQLPEQMLNLGFDCGIVERADRIAFLDFHDPKQALQAGAYARGVAFSGSCELRWFQRASGFHLVYIDDHDEPLPGSTNPTKLEKLQASRHYLWGKGVGSSRILREDRIPRLFRLGGLAEGEMDDYERQPFEYPEWAPVPGDLQRLALRIQWYQLEIASPAISLDSPELRMEKRPTRLFRCVGFTTEDGNE